MGGWRRPAALAAAVGAAGCLWVGSEVSASGGPAAGLEFLGEAIVPSGTTFLGTTVGGLSSITYDETSGEFLALSDDRGTIQPSRYYTLRLNLGDGRLDRGDVQFTGVTTLLAPDGQPYTAAGLDPEGLTLAKGGELIVTSEGIPTRDIAPWVRRYRRDGVYLGDLPVPAPFLPAPGRGVRLNLGFEAAAVAANGRHLLVGTEAALVQDGPAATVANGTPARILRYNLATGGLDRQYVYPADPVAEPPFPGAFSVSGLVELLPFDTQFLLALERSFSLGAPGTGNTIKLFAVAAPGADDVNGVDSLAGAPVRTLRKALLLDLRDLRLPLGNLEGMTLGPLLPDGRRSLVLVSDDNFAAFQVTQFLLFAID
jgi:hypothetical protein